MMYVYTTSSVLTTRQHICTVKKVFFVMEIVYLNMDVYIVKYKVKVYNEHTVNQ